MFTSYGNKSSDTALHFKEIDLFRAYFPSFNHFFKAITYKYFFQMKYWINNLLFCSLKCIGTNKTFFEWKVTEYDACLVITGAYPGSMKTSRRRKAHVRRTQTGLRRKGKGRFYHSQDFFFTMFIWRIWFSWLICKIL